jgi:hypothetical protein
MCDLLLLEYGRRIYFSDHDLVVRVVNINLAIKSWNYPHAGFAEKT